MSSQVMPFSSGSREKWVAAMPAAPTRRAARARTGRLHRGALCRSLAARTIASPMRTRPKPSSSRNRVRKFR